jgi:tetratricopeptide (TPR) repeat protein
MRPSRRITVICASVLVVCLAASVLLLQRLDQLRTSATLPEVLYLSSPKALKRMSLGYDGLLADIYWTRAVQYFGIKHYNGAQQYELLAPLLQITTTLDPHLTVAYEFGANFLAPSPPWGAGEPQKAIQLADFGIRNNPNDWHLYYNLGFIYFTELKDYKNAADAFQRGSRVPNAHPWLKLLGALMAERAGEIKTAQLLWMTTYETTPDRDIRANAAAHLRALQVDDDVTQLEGAVSSYHAKTGRLPESFSDLQSHGLLGAVPLDPLGHAYKLMPDGRVEVSDPDDLPFISKGMPPGFKPSLKPKFLPSD